MSDIVLKKVNETFFKVSCSSDSIEMELSEFFTFLSPNRTFDPRYKARKWDGKIRLFNRRSKQVYVGLLPYIKDFAKRMNYTLSCVDYSKSNNTISITSAKKFIDELDLRNNGKSITARDYQIAPFIVGIAKKRLLFVSPTSSGKSLILYMLIRRLLSVERKKKILLVVPTTTLVRQMHSDFADYSTANGFDVESNTQKIYDFEGKDLYSDKPIFISTWQSLFKLPKEYFERFDVIMGDEAHTCDANSLKKIMENCINAEYRIGCSGTLKDAKVHKLILEGLFGPIEQWIETYQLMERGQAADMDISILVLKYDEPTCCQNKGLDYNSELEYIISDISRMNFVKNLTAKLKGNTLLLYSRVEGHGIPIYEALEKKLAVTGRKLFVVHGKVDTEERDEIRGIVEKENDAIIVASYGTFSTGINIKNIHNIILASPTKSKIRVLQSIGRGLRLCDTKEHLDLYDIVDDMRYDNYVNYGVKHSEERLNYYISEKFKHKFHFINL